MIIHADKLFKSTQLSLTVNQPYPYPLDNNSEYVIVGNVEGGDLWLSIGMSIGAENAIILKDGSTIKIPTPQTLTLECRTGSSNTINIIEIRGYDVGLWLQPEVSGCDCEELEAFSALFETLQVTGTSEFDGDIIRDGASGNNRPIWFKTLGVNRWRINNNSSAESGSNNGSDLIIQRYADDGSLLGAVMSFGRATGNAQINGALELDGTFNHDGSSFGAMGATPVTRPNVTGSRGGNAALASLLTSLASLGLITDSTTV